MRYCQLANRKSPQLSWFWDPSRTCWYKHGLFGKKGDVWVTSAHTYIDGGFKINSKAYNMIGSTWHHPCTCNLPRGAGPAHSACSYNLQLIFSRSYKALAFVLFQTSFNTCKIYAVVEG
jgi:hypothetical protein